tara:strand:- start:2729 stop:4144 length:1416 start_codon:yes stop_codon:yes gene_type:complete
VKASFLIVDDESGVRSALSGVLKDEGYSVDAVESGESCLSSVSQRIYDVIILDIWLPRLDGLETLERLRELGVDSEVVMISGHGNVESAVRAIKMGAFDFVEKPVSLDKIVLVARNALRQRRLEAENRVLRANVDRRYVMVGESPEMKRLRDEISRAAPTNGRVLIYGENGTGKELVARSVHSMSRRSAKPFVEVNCAAIPEELIESELFGYTKGAFTGAVTDRRGKFEVADGGTLFLDEVGDMSLNTQAKVLRVLQEQVVERLGSDGGVAVDVRVLAATNKDLPSAISKGLFRDDLFFRLNVVPIAVPPLRARSQDIHDLANHFLQEFAREYGHRVKEVDPEALIVLCAHGWPGNVRELRNVLERLAIMVPGPKIGAHELEFLSGGDVSRNDAEEQSVPLSEARERFERDYIVRALAREQGNISKTARVLRLERSNLYRKMRAYGINYQGKRSARVAESSEAGPQVSDCI